ncbi:hypothetical protein DIPPA_05046 [Diplonema papillatum]|nr:hypothetical protein DIPPA_05046 [Diplonema papillatum]
MATRRVVHDFTKRQLSAAAADVARELREIEAEYRERVSGIRAHAGKPTFEANLQKAGRGRRREGFDKGEIVAGEYLCVKKRAVLALGHHACLSFNFREVS